jgi:hypothetical protein
LFQEGQKSIHFFRPFPKGKESLGASSLCPAPEYLKNFVRRENTSIAGRAPEDTVPTGISANKS